jgi:hypothetical protein
MGKREYLRLLIPEDELPIGSSIASLITIRHVRGQRIRGSVYGPNYYEHRFPDSVMVTDRTPRKD